MTVNPSRIKLILVAGVSLLFVGALYAAITVEIFPWHERPYWIVGWSINTERQDAQDAGQ